MSSRGIFTDRHGGRGHPSHRAEATASGERSWRRTLAALAISALAAGGMAALAAAPAAAEEAAGAASEAEVEAPVDEVAETPAHEVTESPAPEVTETPAPADDVAEAAEPAADPADASAGDTVEAPSAAALREAPAADAADVTLLLEPPGDEVFDKVEICHATSSYQNPYIINEPAADGDVSGHADHTGPIFFLEIPKHTEWGDIIPPFFYDDGDETPGFFPGLNWTAEGEAIYANDCEIPTPEPDLAVFPEGCRFYEDTGAVEVEVGPVQENVDYRVTIRDSAGNLVAEWLISGSTGTVSNFWILPPGDFTITLEQSIIEGEWELLDEQAFSLSACPDLAATATVFECSTGGGPTGTGTTVVLFTGLIPGERYSFLVFQGPGDFENSGEFIASGPSSEFSADLPPGDFVASITWIPGPGAELLDPVTATTTFTVVPCPVPAKPVTPAGLAVTGTESAPFVSVALLLLGLGGTALLASRRPGPALFSRAKHERA